MNKLFKKIDNIWRDKNLKEIISQSSITFVGRGLAVISAFAFNSVVAKLYGAEITGSLALLITFLNFASIFTLLGFNVSILRFVPEFIIKFNYKTAYSMFKKMIAAISFSSLLFAIFSYAGADVIARHVFRKPELYNIIRIGSILVIFKSYFVLGLEGFRSLKKIKLFAFSQFAYWISIVIILISLDKFLNTSYLPLYVYSLLLIIFSLLFLLQLSFLFIQNTSKKEQIFPFKMVEIFKISLPMFLTSSMMYILGQVDIFMLGAFKSKADVGIYYVAVRLALITSFILNAINSIAAPKFSELYQKNDIAELLRIAKGSTKIIFYLTVPIILILLIWGKKILFIFFGHEFVQAYPALLVLVGSQFINAISGSVGYFMNMTGGEKIFRNVMIITVLINIILNYILIPVYGILGAAIASSGSTIFWNIYLVLYIKKKYGRSISYFPLIG